MSQQNVVTREIANNIDSSSHSAQEVSSDMTQLGGSVAQTLKASSDMLTAEARHDEAQRLNTAAETFLTELQAA